MSCATTPFAVVCSVMLGVVAAGAQSPSSNGSFSIAAGVGQSARSDAAVSPDRFDGFGPDIALAYRMRAGHADVRLEATAALRSLGAGAAGGAGGPTERTSQGGLDALVLAARGQGTPALELGIDAGVTGALIDHRLAGSSASSFGFAAATLGPAAAWSRGAGPGTLELTVATSIVSLVMQPYEALRDVTPVPPMRTATIASLQAIQASLRYDPAARRAGRRGRFSYQYHIAVFHYGSDSPVRELTQALSVGVAWGSRTR
ncbi:MAG: hypothetical protein ACHQWU_04320 [Gemmatimonadales bacterium]